MTAGLALPASKNLGDDLSGGYECLFSHRNSCDTAPAAVALFAPLGVAYVVCNLVVIEQASTESENSKRHTCPLIYIYP